MFKSQQHTSPSQGRTCSGNFTLLPHWDRSCRSNSLPHQSHRILDTGPTSPSADPITPGAWQGSHGDANFLSHWYDLTRENPHGSSGNRTPDLSLSRGTLLPLGQRGDDWPWVSIQLWSASSISVWQHVRLSEQASPQDTFVCCWDVKQARSNNGSRNCVGSLRNLLVRHWYCCAEAVVMKLLCSSCCNKLLCSSCSAQAVLMN